MDNTIKHNPLLALLDYPAFMVKDGVIVQANTAALAKNISVGQQIANYLGPLHQVYHDTSWACLYLRLQLSIGAASAIVTVADDMHLFCLDMIESAAEDTQLNCIAQIAMQLRRPLHSMFCIEEARIHDQELRRDLYQLHRIVSNMADLSRFRDTDNLTMESTDLFWFFSELTEKATALLEKVHIQLDFAALPQCVYGCIDRELLERAVYNLISNAAKFSPAYGIIKIKLSVHGNMLYFTIQDQGPGIDSDILGNIFRRYRRGPAIEDGRFGTGLGMAIVKAAADVHDGTILIDRPVNGGTRITLTISIKEGGYILRSPIRLPRREQQMDQALLELCELLPSNLF